MGIGNFQRYEEEARKEALDKGWEFERLKGDVGLLRRLIDGNWNRDEFLIVDDLFVANTTISPGLYEG